MLHFEGEERVFTAVEFKYGRVSVRSELGLLAIEPLPKEETSHDIDPGMKIFQEAEEDRDHLYHPPPETPREIRRAPLRLKYQHAPNEPEEDRDHLYHP
ncbi:hypothetical protein FKM82_017679 [Ascaphus truei]